MPVKEKFTVEEWQKLQDLVPLAGVMVIAADQNVLGMLKENGALVQNTLSGANTYHGNQLIAELSAEFAAPGSRWKMESFANNPYFTTPPEELAAVIRGECRDVLTILEKHEDRLEADSYKHWVVRVATSVAEAAKEGGFLGIGGVVVSDAEQEVIEMLRSALGV